MLSGGRYDVNCRYRKLLGKSGISTWLFAVHDYTKTNMYMRINAFDKQPRTRWENSLK